MSQTARPARRQLTLFVPPEAGALIEALRARLDPVQHRLIAAHVTLCREDELLAIGSPILRQRIADLVGQPPLRLAFGSPVRGEGHGLFLPCVEGEPAYAAARRLILQSEAVRRSSPHITLAHPRNPRAPGNTDDLPRLPGAPLEIRFPEISLIEQQGAQAWRILERFLLPTCS